MVFFTAYQLPSLLGDFTTLEGLKLVDTAAGFSFPGLWLGGLYKALTTTSIGWMAYAQAALALFAAGFTFGKAPAMPIGFYHLSTPVLRMQEQLKL